MNILAFVLAVIAVACFAIEWFGRPARRSLLALGLALLGSAWIAQLVWVTTHVVKID